ncbi:MAG: hypothetical protein GF320_22450 [Armatimonadia bacterium]|nr:hypothetical protein [Armatimonadia bacterium]
MAFKRIAAVFGIFVLTSVGWAILGGTTAFRSSDTYSDLGREVSGIYGAPIVQRAPTFEILRPKDTDESSKEGDDDEAKVRWLSRTAEPDANEIDVALDLDLRKKGLLWFRTYGVAFDATYTLKGPFEEGEFARVTVPLPQARATYDQFLFEVNGRSARPGGDLSGGLTVDAPVTSGEDTVVRLRYETRGMDRWEYSFGAGTAQVKDLDMEVVTDFADYDFPAQGLAPSSHGPDGEGQWKLEWDSDALLTGAPAAVIVPGKLNPGPLASRITFFAPVGLLFFLAVVVIIGAARGNSLHSMHYFFICAAFFAFHLLFSYLVDHVDINAGFLLAAATSVLLVASYVLRIKGARYALGIIAPAQILFLILFSYAFFFKGYTGLTITIASVVTLAALMHITAGVKWDELRPAEAETQPQPTPETAG